MCVCECVRACMYACVCVCVERVYKFRCKLSKYHVCGIKRIFIGLWTTVSTDRQQQKKRTRDNTGDSNFPFVSSGSRPLRLIFYREFFFFYDYYYTCVCR